MDRMYYYITLSHQSIFFSEIGNMFCLYLFLCQIRIECVSEEFTGKSAVQRQRLIYKAIWDELNGTFALVV